MKKMNKFFKNQDGLSIVSVIGSIAVLGVGLVAAINLSKMSKIVLVEMKILSKKCLNRLKEPYLSF
jgi:hypothetical protein